LRQLLSTHKAVARKLAELELHLQNHDEQIQVIFEAIRQLITPAERKRKQIGFHLKEHPAIYRTKRM
jgi:isopropylmalate/homocitrate/citramalate synthase